jgi:hypothetical protein
MGLKPRIARWEIPEMMTMGKKGDGYRAGPHRSDDKMNINPIRRRLGFVGRAIAEITRMTR